ncbi:hypothetical protein GUITHDRAFT_65378 [Guillardia theta CCMP2712]|uniref:Inosine/uridine-preferring nucleoside hydrolase domain-containing protein n=1 Tax=Guillardia theta (strain CCMP2712) TaxID=905079 RepID=L1JUV9_GUITC|nr:hypothetical protein GUITHDRAFT_65378 [Guillardia theta CCMP2712]EKX52187.1 hypothetical protein GUITHDRAFT_65378 [Guillardia theta CCMP2712]|eukprot:XP_005839167.1 hypothetical protein GUITHDRAFT_65378 [Guillardia theta CCMP2712]
MRVFVSGDGGVDDLAALTMTVAAMMAGSIEIVGVAVTGGNCFLDAGVQASRKILDLAGLDGKVQVSTCDAEGVNPFPRSWRSASYGICHIPRLLRDGRPRTELLQTPAHIHLAECCMKSNTPITVLETGPLTCMARALHAFPELAKPDRISQLVWMGGAIDVEGNVHREGTDGSAEWNVYWDPLSAKKVIDAGPKLRICPLDVCNQAPITTKFLVDLYGVAVQPSGALKVAQVYADQAFRP